MGENARKWLFFSQRDSGKMFAENIEEREENGDTALHRAAYHNCIDVAKAVLEAGADVNARNHTGDTALHVLVSETFGNYLEIGNVLVDEGAELLAKNKSRMVALDIAEVCNHPLAEMLRKKMKI